MDNRMKKFTLIMPMLSLSEEYPIEFKENNKTGIMKCIHSLIALDITQFTDIVFVILKKHDELYNIKNKITTELKRQNPQYEYILKKCNIKFVIADQPTRSQAETVFNTIKQLNITGPIFIKDADNQCNCSVKPGNTILTYPIEELEIIDPQHKSYVDVDEQNFVTNIIEKRVISGLISSGGYGFSDAELFVDGYQNVLNFSEGLYHIYISHIIYWLILFRNEKFRPVNVSYYDDYKVDK